jgi:hypothetical protein
MEKLLSSLTLETMESQHFRMRLLSQVDAHLNYLIHLVYFNKANTLIERNGSLIGVVYDDWELAEEGREELVGHAAIE